MVEEDDDELEDLVDGGVRSLGTNPWVEIYTVENKRDDWKRSTQVMEIPGVGCVIKSFFQLDDMASESMTLVPGTKLVNGKVIKDE